MNKLKIYLVVIAITALIVTALVQCHTIHNLKKNTDTIYRIDTITQVDTIQVERIIKDTKTITKMDTITRIDTIINTKDNQKYALKLHKKTYSNTLSTDSDTIQYTADISGYSLNDDGYPRLDSILFKTKFKKINTNKIITKTIQKKRHFNVSPSIGFGYGITHKQTDIYVGITLGYSIY